MIPLYATFLIMVIAVYLVIGALILASHEYHDGVEPLSVRLRVITCWGFFLSRKRKDY